MTKFDEIPKDAMYKAFKRIHRLLGNTCPNFPECDPGDHIECHNSYDAWAIADMVLHYEPGKNYPFEKETV